ncbi:hypothetical protein EDD17DRAFT_1770874 [Pisolithus thermaeus]|nr:hypothetical protein EDD17DRAFT_1770874 [Pisolithus thermaeus]
MPDPTQALWCVCRKYCKGICRPINTVRTWKRHLCEADDDEKASIRLASCSDAFRAFIASSTQTSNASGETGTPKRPRLSPAAEHHPQLPRQGDGHRSEVRDYHHLDKSNHEPPDRQEGDQSYLHNDMPGYANHESVYRPDGDEYNGPGNIFDDDGPGDILHDNNSRELCNNDGPLASRENDQPAECNDNPPPTPPACSPLLNLDIEELIRKARLPKLQRALHFVQDIRNASLDDGVGLTGEQLMCLRNPPKEALSIEDPSIEIALSMFIALEHSSESMYAKIQWAIQKGFPDSELPTFHQTK